MISLASSFSSIGYDAHFGPKAQYAPLLPFILASVHFLIGYLPIRLSRTKKQCQHMPPKFQSMKISCFKTLYIQCPNQHDGFGTSAFLMLLFL